MGGNDPEREKVADDACDPGPEPDEGLRADREEALARRRDAADEILAAADARDDDADARDAAAVERENAFDKEDFMRDEGAYSDHWPERRAAGLDREHSKGDRTASRDDRVALTEDLDDAGPAEDHDRVGPTEDRHEAEDDTEP